jgi:hypothetical protein
MSPSPRTRVTAWGALAGVLALCWASPTQAQAPAQAPAPPSNGFPGLAVGHRPRVEIPWNRFYDTAELYALLDRLMAEWPDKLSYEVIGHSVQGRELRVYTLNDPSTGPDRSKPAMWVDANVHGNEVQGSEATLYLAWYLLENHEHNPRAAELLRETSFYLMPSVNPDGRDSWLHEAHTASSSRTGYLPVDDDGDGLFDEDPPNDLDGDGHITQMRKYVPGRGTHRLDPDDPRILVPVPENDRGVRGDWVLLGQEGSDLDGDGRVNEDGPGTYDMNRAWPSWWMPDHVQGGAGPYPLYWPETRSQAQFMLERPNIAAVQSFHNSGGMLLRGPGTAEFGEYPRADLRVYDELGRDGEQMLPFYRYLIIWKDLYSVFGGFVTWTYESLGIISFTNELWNERQMVGDAAAGRRGREGQHRLDDLLTLGAGFVDWRPFDHPQYGAIEIGGFKKDVGRVPPTFMIEEMLHRNALFCVAHADAMPRVVIEEVEVTPLGDGLLAVDAVFRNQRLIPTRSARAAEQKIGRPDLFTLEGEGLEVLAGGFRRDRWRPAAIDLAERDPARLVSESGIGPRGRVSVRWIARGTGQGVLSWSGEKARHVSLTVDLDAP